MTPYEHLLAKAEEIGWPAYYKDDLLKHDRQELEGMQPDISFLWFVRETGTWLITPNGYGHPKYEGGYLIPGKYSQPHRGFVWTGSDLIEIPEDKWDEYYSRYIRKPLKGCSYKVAVTEKYRLAPWQSKQTSKSTYDMTWCKDKDSLRQYVIARTTPKGIDREITIEIFGQVNEKEMLIESCS